MTFLLNELLYRCYDCFSSLIKFWSGERYIEIVLYFNEKSDYYE